MKKYLLLFVIFSFFTTIPTLAQEKSEGLRILEELHNLPENYQDNPEIQKMVVEIEKEKASFFNDDQQVEEE